MHYPLIYQAFDEVKMEEDKKFKELEQRYSMLEEKMEKRFQQIISSIDLTKLS